MDGYVILLVLYGFFALLIAPILGSVAYRNTVRQQGTICHLQSEIQSLRKTITRLVEEGPPTDTVSTKDTLNEDEESPVPKPVSEPTAPARPEPPSVPIQSAPTQPAPRKAKQATAAARQNAGTARKKTQREEIESRLGGRYLVWLGGLTVLLAGVFLVKYSITEGLLSPALRVVMGMLLGIGLCSLSEWVRIRKPVLVKSGSRLTPDWVSLSLSFAGVVTVYGSLYAGYALHGLMGETVTFAALAFTSLCALLLSLRQGPALSVPSLVGAFVVPILIPSDDPSLIALNLYLVCVAGMGLGVARFLNFDKMVALPLIGTALWIGVEIMMLPKLGLGEVWSTFALLALMPLHYLIAYHRMDQNHRHWVELTGAGAAVLAWLILLKLGVTGDTVPGLVAVGGVLVTLALRHRWAERLVLPAAMLAVAGHVQWVQPQVNILSFLYSLWDSRFEARVTGMTLDALSQDWQWGAALAAGFAALAAYALRDGRKTTLHGAIWGGVGAVVPAAILVVTHWSYPTALGQSIWGALFLLLAVLTTLAVLTLDGRKDREWAVPVMAVTAVAVLIYGGVVALDRAALTIGLCGLLAAIAWVMGHRPVPGMGLALRIVAGLTLARLPLIHVLYDGLFLGGGGVFTILTSFGIVAVTFYLTAHFIQSGPSKMARDHHWMAAWFELGAQVIGTLTASLLLRHLFYAGEWRTYGLDEQGFQSSLWMAVGGLILCHGLDRKQKLSQIAGYVFLAVAAIHILGIQVLLCNPLFTDHSVGAGFPFNDLLPGYLLPGLAAAWVAWSLKRRGEGEMSVWLIGLSLILGFLYASLSVRQIFQGPVLSYSLPTSDGEGYAYSAVWLLLGLGMLLVGLWRGNPVLRHVSLGVVLLVVAKTFLWDMASLDGLYRVASFMGLGLSLIGIGYLYQRVLPRLTEKARVT